MARTAKTPEDAERQVLRELLSTRRLSPEQQLDQLLVHLGLRTGQPHDLAVYSHLLPLFRHARAQGVGLFPPGEDFHAWFQVAVQLNTRDPDVPLKANTVLARTSALSRLYTRLVERGVLSENPLRGLPRPRKERRAAPLPHPDEVLVLLTQTQARDPRLCAAMRLVYHLAFTRTALQHLRWEELDLERGRLLRGELQARLPVDVVRALSALPDAPRPLAPARPKKKVFPLDEQSFKAAWWKAELNAGVKLSLGTLRLCGLRDHPDSGALFQDAEQRGYRDPYAYEKSLELARRVGVREKNSGG